MLDRFRRRLDAAVENRVNASVDRTVASRITQFEERFNRALKDYEARLAGNQADFSYVRSEFDRIAPQLAALEQRFEWLRNQLAIDELDPESVLARAQLEHERARIRLELAAHYEERLRRLEEADV